MVNTQEQNVRKCPGLSQVITSHSSENWNKPQYSKGRSNHAKIETGSS